MTPREIVEACEALPGEPWPARFARPRAARSELELTLSQDTAGGARPPTSSHAASRSTSRGLPLVCAVVDGPSPAALRPLRADLIESTFTAEQEELSHARRNAVSDRRRDRRIADRRARARSPTSAACASSARRSARSTRATSASSACFIVALPVLYLVVPPGVLTGFLVVTFMSALMIALRPLVSTRVLWVAIPVLLDRQPARHALDGRHRAAGCSSTGC